MGHNHTAFAPEDVDDARRGTPATSLQSWAAPRGLLFTEAGLTGAFVTVLPRFPEYTFNVCRGEVAPGRYGQVAHLLEELAATEGSIDGGGTFYGTRLVTKRNLLSFVGIEKDRPDEPFAANAAWAPITGVALRVPELVLLPRFVVRTSSTFLNLGGGRDVGLPGLRLLDNQWIGDDLAAAIGAAVQPLGGLGANYVRLLVDHGQLSLVRNGFVAEPERLDHLLATAVAVADALADSAPQATGTPPWCQPLEHEVDVFRRAAAELAMNADDPVAFHRAVRRSPLPGRVHGLLHGTVPGTHAEGRVAFTVQGGRTTNTYRTGVVVPAAPGATTPVGGTVHAPTDQYAEVVDGLAYSWPRVRSVGRLDSAERTAAGVQTLRDMGLASL